MIWRIFCYQLKQVFGEHILICLKKKIWSEGSFATIPNKCLASTSQFAWKKNMIWRIFCYHSKQSVGEHILICLKKNMIWRIFCYKPKQNVGRAHFPNPAIFQAIMLSFKPLLQVTPRNSSVYTDLWLLAQELAVFALKNPQLLPFQTKCWRA